MASNYSELEETVEHQRLHIIMLEKKLEDYI